MFSLLKRYRDLILVAILLLVPLGVFFAHAKRPSDQSRFDRAVLWVTGPVERGIGWVITGVLEGWNGYVALRHAHERATELTREVNLLKLERDHLLQERAEAERVRKLLGFADGAPQRTYAGAHVIGVRLGAPGLQIVTIDRGRRDGIDRMMPVVVAEGVVGRVHSVTERTADVLLLVDRNSSIAVRVERTRARANVRGQGKPGACKLDYALRTEDMVEGDRLVTAGTDGVFPRGLAVGRVMEVKKNGHGLFQDAIVVPAVDVTRVEEVLVVTSHELPSAEEDEGAVAEAGTPAAGTPAAPATGAAPKPAVASGTAAPKPAVATGTATTAAPKPATSTSPSAAAAPKPATPTSTSTAAAPKRATSTSTSTSTSTAAAPKPATPTSISTPAAPKPAAATSTAATPMRATATPAPTPAPAAAPTGAPSTEPKPAAASPAEAPKHDAPPAAVPPAPTSKPVPAPSAPSLPTLAPGAHTP